jgi:D-glycero-D-manno-heptose 1,7-bisphosphate phosphatase
MKNILLDRDGTIIEDAHYLASPDQIRLLPNAGRALKRLQDSGLRLYMLSNQSGVGRGYFSRRQHEAVQSRVKDVLLEQGVRLNGERFCFHAPEEGCSCRKPAPGLWDELAAEEGLSADESLMIGDKAEDMRLAARARLAGSILVLTGYGRQSAWELGLPTPDCGWEHTAACQPCGHPSTVASDLLSASDWILDTPSGLRGQRHSEP